MPNAKHVIYPLRPLSAAHSNVLWVAKAQVDHYTDSQHPHDGPKYATIPFVLSFFLSFFFSFYFLFSFFFSFSFLHKIGSSPQIILFKMFKNMTYTAMTPSLARSKSKSDLKNETIREVRQDPVKVM